MIAGVEVKTFELRDECTFIPVFCIRFDVAQMEEKDRWLMCRGGWEADDHLVYMTGVCDGETQWDPYRWGQSRTRHVAHFHINEHWHELKSGDVIDVGFILGFSAKPKKSEMEQEEAEDE